MQTDERRPESVPGRACWGCGWSASAGLRAGAGFAAEPALVTLARVAPVTAGKKVSGGSFRKMGARGSSRIRVVRWGGG